MRTLLSRAVVLALLGAALACASAPGARSVASATSQPRTASVDAQIAEAAARGADPSMQQVCEYEAPTGSHLREWTCRYLTDQERDRMATQRMLLRAPGSAGPVVPSGGGR